MQKMSDVLAAVSQSGFKTPNTPQRENDLAIALYYAQLAWNTANGTSIAPASVELVCQQMDIPQILPSSFKTRNANELLSIMARYKQLNYPNDNRLILACCFENEKIKVHWQEGCTA
ncbi:MAG: hypothetical protein KUG82_15405 [Pseudomonadales bacterium]|nr:hypothetical protein [Pseudomonadales bacterium]